MSKNVQFALNKNCMLEVYGVFAVYMYHLGFSSKQFQSCNKSLINQACSGPYWENIGPWSFLYGPRCAWSVLSRPQADIFPVRPSHLVNKINILTSRLVNNPYNYTLIHVINSICAINFLQKVTDLYFIFDVPKSISCSHVCIIRNSDKVQL